MGAYVLLCKFVRVDAFVGMCITANVGGCMYIMCVIVKGSGWVCDWPYVIWGMDMCDSRFLCECACACVSGWMSVIRDCGCSRG